MPRRTIHRRRRAQGGCLSFAIGVLTLAALALVVAIVVTSRLTPKGDDITKPAVNGGSYVNFRKGASLSASIIDRIDVGTSVTVIEHGTDWCKVVIDGVEGYMSTWFLKW